MRVRRRADLPERHRCLACDTEKPLVEMIVVRERRTRHFLVRARCKLCHNLKERGHRRAYKTKYLRRWRDYNSELNESYWRAYNRDNREKISKRAAVRFANNHEAILIQGRMGRHGFPISLEEARQLLKQFGRCYPMRPGLTPRGHRECERIRSRLRLRGEKPNLFENSHDGLCGLGGKGSAVLHRAGETARPVSSRGAEFARLAGAEGEMKRYVEVPGMEITLGSEQRAFICLDCGQFFVWHPGDSGLSKPSGCGACDSANLQEQPDARRAK